LFTFLQWKYFTPNHQQPKKVIVANKNLIDMAV